MFIALLAATLCQAVVLLYHSRNTPFSLQRVFNISIQDMHTSEEIQVVDVDSEKAQWGEGDGAILDYTYSENWSSTLSALSPQYLAMYMSDERPSAKGGWKQYGTVVTDYLEKMNLTRAVIVSNSIVQNAKLSHWLADQHPSIYLASYVLPPASDYDFCLNFTGKVLKPSGYAVFVLFLDPIATYNILKAFDAKRMNKPGFAYILSEEASFYRELVHPLDASLLRTGVLFIGEHPSAIQSTREAAESLILIEVLKQLQQSGSSVRAPHYGLFSMVESVPLLSVKAPIEISATTVYRFPGNSTSAPILGKAQLTALVNYKLINPDLTLYPPSPQLMRGFEVAFAEVNKRPDLLPNYYIKDQSVNYTGMAFNYQYSKEQVMRNPYKDALAYMTAPSAQSIIGINNLFAELELPKPIVACSLSSRLSDPKQYPLYLRPRVANKYLMTVIARVVQLYSWTHITVLYAEGDADYEDAHDAIKSASLQYGVSIVNRESRRSIPAALNNSTASVVDTAIQEIIATGVRVILVLHNFPFVVMEQMYNLGIREEYVMMFIGAVNDSIFRDPEFIKRRIVSKSCILFIPKMFVGPTGARVRSALVSKDGGKVVPNTCQYYDGAMLLFHALDFLLTRGMDYEDPYELAKSMRETHFEGCSGLIKIESGSNDRAASQIDLMQFQYDSESDTYTFPVVASYNPFAVTVFSQVAPMQWPDDKVKYADTKPQYKNCPFLEEDIVASADGHKVAYAACSGICLMVTVVTVLIWKRWWNVASKPLAKKYDMSLEDVLVLVSVVLDYFEFASVGPDVSHISRLLATVNSSMSLQIESLLAVTHGVYWVVLELVFGIVLLWSFLCALKFTGLDRRVGRFCGCIEWWSDLLMPTFGNLLFLPIVSTLLGVFLCYKAAGPEMTDAFLNRDCTQRCWTHEHYFFIAGSCAALAMYVPLAVFTRPLWQEMQRNAHVKASPISLMLKSLVQMVLIVASALVKSEHPGIHAYIYFTVIVSYIAFLVRVRQFNYSRLNLWQVILMTAVLLLSVVAYLTRDMGSAELPLSILLLAAAYTAMGLGGLVLQRVVKRFESKLQRSRRMDVRHLFRFAFTAGKTADEALRKHYSANPSANTKISAITADNK